MRGGDSRLLVLALGILIVAGFYSSFLGSSVTGQQVSDVRAPPAVLVPVASDCVRDELQIPVGDDKKTITKSFTFCGTIPLTKEYFIKKGITISCQANTKVVYGREQPQQFNGLHIFKGIVGAGGDKPPRVKIDGCIFEGAFKNVIVNSGEDTTVSNNQFIGVGTAVHETVTATNGLYDTLVVQNSANPGLILEGKDAVVQDSTFTKNPKGILIGRPMVSLLSGTVVSGMICELAPSGPIPGEVICADPDSGENVQVLGSTFSQNSVGVEVHGLHVRIENENKFSKNHDAIFVFPLLVGSVYEPPTPIWAGSYWDFFISDITIQNNEIKGNDGAGIVLSGNTMNTVGTWYYGSIGIPPSAFYAITTIRNNVIEENNQGVRLECPINYGPGWGWAEFSLVENNEVNKNGEGIGIDCGGLSLNVVNNRIKENLKNGIRVGDGDPEISKMKCNSVISLIYNNEVTENQWDGVRVECGRVYYVTNNKFNTNVLNGFRQGPVQSFEQPVVYNIECNDLSFNGFEGYHLNAEGGSLIQSHSGDLINYFLKNRVINNGVLNSGDGASFVIKTPSSPGFTPYGLPGNSVGPIIYLNLFRDNQRYGLSLKGPFGAGIFKNNFFPNNLGLVEDTGANTYENLWDEAQYRSVVSTFFRGYCFSPTGLLVPCGNYFDKGDGPIPPVYEVNVQKPPLLACSAPCLFSCYTAKNVCGDRDEITSPNPFVGHYDPEIVGNNCPIPSYAPPLPSGPKCGDGFVDPGEECDPGTRPPQCPGGQLCSADCHCPSKTKTKTYTPFGSDPPYTTPPPPNTLNKEEMYKINLEQNLERRKKMLEEKYIQ